MAWPVCPDAYKWMKADSDDAVEESAGRKGQAASAGGGAV